MDTLESRLEDLVAELEFAGDWNDRYRMLVAWGEELDALAEDQRTADWDVPGCSSPLWLQVLWDRQPDRPRLAVRGYSPGILPKALVAVVVRLFDGLEVVEGTTNQLLERLDFRRNLSSTRYSVLEHLVDRALAVGRGR